MGRRRGPGTCPITPLFKRNVDEIIGSHRRTRQNNGPEKGREKKKTPTQKQNKRKTSQPAPLKRVLAEVKRCHENGHPERQPVESCTCAGDGCSGRSWRRAPWAGFSVRTSESGERSTGENFTLDPHYESLARLQYKSDEEERLGGERAFNEVPLNHNREIIFLTTPTATASRLPLLILASTMSNQHLSHPGIYRWTKRTREEGGV